MPDLIPESREAELLSKYPEGRVRIIGGLWFHLSIYFSTELPLEVFEPKFQRSLREKEINQAISEGKKKPKKSELNTIAACIKRLLGSLLEHYSNTNSVDWQSSHLATKKKIK